MAIVDMPPPPDFELKRVGEDREAFLEWYYNLEGWDCPDDELADNFYSEFEGTWESEAEFICEDIKSRDPDAAESGRWCGYQDTMEEMGYTFINGSVGTFVFFRKKVGG